MIEVAIIKDPCIELHKLLKLENIAESGGEAKQMIGQGLVRVNGVVESRKRRKIYPNDLVECGTQRVQILQNTGQEAGQPSCPQHGEV
jgi:ribosome-associated protein